MRKQGCCLWMELTSSAAGSPSQVAVTDGIEDHGAIPPPKRAGESGDSVGRAGTSGGASVGDTLNEVSTGTLNTDGEGQYINRNEVLADLSLWKAQYDEKEEERNGKGRRQETWSSSPPPHRFLLLERRCRLSLPSHPGSPCR